MVNLRLHCGYIFSGITNYKTGQQFVGPLKILEQIGKLVYRLEILIIWKIHLVILVTHLELATQQSKKTYHRPKMNYPGPMEPKKDVKNTGDHYIVEKLFSKQVTPGRTQYLVQ